MELGASFSHLHLKHLGLNPDKAIIEFKSLGLEWVRLGCYWNEIEKNEGSYDFSLIEPFVKYCEKNEIKIVMTVGMKAPRWPEYYLPNWLTKKLQINNNSDLNLENELLLSSTLKFVARCLRQFDKYKLIKVWQIENEPLDPSGPNGWKISPTFLKQEKNLINSVAINSETKVNLWGNELSKRAYYKEAIKIADIIGLTIFLKCPTSDNPKESVFEGPSDSRRKMLEIAGEVKSGGKKLWITELQAEPWEPGELVTTKKNPPSFLPKHFKTNLDYAKHLDPEVVLLWGFEYWLWRKEKLDDTRYWNEAKKLASRHR